MSSESEYLPSATLREAIERWRAAGHLCDVTLSNDGQHASLNVSVIRYREPRQQLAGWWLMSDEAERARLQDGIAQELQRQLTAPPMTEDEIRQAESGFG